MSEQTKNPRRGLESVSHLFLSSGNGPSPPRETKEPGGAPPAPSGTHPGEKPDPAVLSVGPVRVMTPAEDVCLSKATIVEAARLFLLTRFSAQGFTSADDISSPRFGRSDLLLAVKRKGQILAAKVCEGPAGEDFFASSLAYFSWLRESLTALGPLLGRPAAVQAYWFAKGFPPSMVYLSDALSEEASLHLVEYAVLQTPGDKEPVMHFRAVNERARQALSQRQKEEADRHDLGPEDWQAFQELKQRALTEPTE